jgi:MFS family permease
MSTLSPTDEPRSPPPLSSGNRLTMLGAGFLAWLFAGLQISLFPLIHRPAMLDVLPSPGEAAITQWFAWYQCAFLFGAAAGGWIFGWWGDRFGRTQAMGLAVLCYSVLVGATYFAADATQMLVLRFLACLGVGGVWPNAVALVAEAWPAASRPFLAGVMGAAANVGFVLLGIIGYSIPITPDDWRWVLLVAASPVLVGLLTLLAVPESAAWRAAARTPGSAAAGGPGPLREVFTPPLLRRTVFGIILGAIPVVGTAANANWLVPWTDQVAGSGGRNQESGARIQRQSEGRSGSRLTEDEEMNRGQQVVSVRRDPDLPSSARKGDPRSKARTQITRSSGATVGSLLGGIIASLLGRRLTYFLISVASFGVSSFIFGTLDPLHPWFQWFAFLLGFVGVTYFGWLPLYLPELFPTRARSTGSGISFNTGRIVAGFVVLGAGFLIELVAGDYAAVGFWSGMIYLVGAVVIWFAPRTGEESGVRS